MIPCNTVLQGDALTLLKTLPDTCVQCVITSPPYFHLRSYLPRNAPDKHLEIGQEETPQAYIMHLVEVFHEVYRMLALDGVCWLNIADTYSSEKQLLGIPWRLAFALQDEGWFVRQEGIWQGFFPETAIIISKTGITALRRHEP